MQNQSPSSNFQRFSQLPDLLFSKQYFQNRAQKDFQQTNLSDGMKSKIILLEECGLQGERKLSVNGNVSG